MIPSVTSKFGKEKDELLIELVKDSRSIFDASDASEL